MVTESQAEPPSESSSPHQNLFAGVKDLPGLKETVETNMPSLFSTRWDIERDDLVDFAEKVIELRSDWWALRAIRYLVVSPWTHEAVQGEKGKIPQDFTDDYAPYRLVPIEMTKKLVRLAASEDPIVLDIFDHLSIRKAKEYIQDK